MSGDVERSRHPWGWIGLCAVLALAAAGLALWAFSAQSELDDVRAELEQQRAATRAAQREERTFADEVEALRDRVQELEGELGGVLDELEERAGVEAEELQDSLEGALDDLEDAVGGS